MLAERGKVAFDVGLVDVGEGGRFPLWIPVLVHHLRPDSLAEIGAGEAAEPDAVFLIQCLFQDSPRTRRRDAR